MNYNRITKRCEDGGVRSNIKDLKELLERVAEIEDKIEIGKLVELPIEVGDIRYMAKHKSIIEIGFRRKDYE